MMDFSFRRSRREIDWDKVKTVEDVKAILIARWVKKGHTKMFALDDGSEDYDDVRKFYKQE